MSGPGAAPRLRLRALAGRWAVCRLPPATPLAAIGEGPFFSVTRTPDELSIVCREDRAPRAARVESGWRLLQVSGPLDFSEVGVLAALAAPLAAAGVPIFVVSTWDTDYLLVKEERWPAAARALKADGIALDRADG